MESLETTTIELYRGPEMGIFAEPEFMNFMRRIKASPEDSSYDSKDVIKYFNWNNKARICYQKRIMGEKTEVKVTAESRLSYFLESLKRRVDVAASEI